WQVRRGHPTGAGRESAQQPGSWPSAALSADADRDLVGAQPDDRLSDASRPGPDADVGPRQRPPLRLNAEPTLQIRLRGDGRAVAPHAVRRVVRYELARASGHPVGAVLRRLTPDRDADNRVDDAVVDRFLGAHPEVAREIPVEILFRLAGMVGV